MVPSVHLHPNCDLPAAPLQLPPASANRTPVPVGTNYPIWQSEIAAPGGGTDGAGFISQPGAVHFGHDIAPSMPSLRWLLLQVSYLKGAICYRTSNYVIVAVSCPPEFIDKIQRMKDVSFVKCRAFCSSLLLLAGDVESNPGPMTKTEADTFSQALDAIRKLEESQDTLLAELKALKEKHIEATKEIQLLMARVAALESTTTSPHNTGVTEASANALRTVSSQVTEILSRCNNSENRLRRSNLVFFGLDDEPKEYWAKSEQKIIDFCSEKLGITVTERQFERVHRIGKYTEDKRRPIIAKLAFFKDKE
ncbi:hypothetical protein HPB51_000990 [Rhipicephalus microplus]|uniref:Uncharacterized protein n=1 Tax=Rhipicephalus microplus TaxID=6941 RepID=A0A9J6DE26_RHIMP|nr:hypothetical protein HPB51_000990 [Rhipicephalus microplus]